MARNQEKANSMLNRWWAGKNGLLTQAPKRPRFVVKVASLKDAEQWRMDVIKETTKCIAMIQNPTLAEDRIRSLNDEINKLIRERGAWERHIRSLGGADYGRAAAQAMSEVGILGSGGYRYFGAAKNLPGVKELLNESDGQRSAKPGESLKSADGRDMRDVYQSCDAEYFGYDDLYNPGADSRTAADAANAATSTPSVTSETTSDVVSRDAQRQRVLALERAAEKRMRDEAVASWRAAKRKRALAARGIADDGTNGVGGDDNDDDNDMALNDEALNAAIDEEEDDDGMAALLEHYQAPSQEQIKSALDAAALAKAKAALLKKLTANSKQ